MYCKNCGKEIEDDSRFCNYCGFNFSGNKSNNKFDINNILIQFNKFKDVTISRFMYKIKTDNKTRNCTIIATFIAIICLIFLINNMSLNKYENQIYEGCLDIKSQLKDPNSFILYDRAIVIKPKKENDYYAIFEYGGSNSYGGTIKSQAVLKNGRYIMDTDHEWKYGEENYKEILDVQMIIASYKFDKSTGDVDKNYETHIIDLSKIKRKLNMK